MKVVKYFIFAILMLGQVRVLAKYSDLFPNDLQYKSCMEYWENYAEEHNLKILLEPIKYYSYLEYTLASVGFFIGTVDPETGQYNGLGWTGCGANLSVNQIYPTNKQPYINSTRREAIACGSEIDFESKVVTESLPIFGTELTLNYTSGYNSLSPTNKKVKTSFNFRNLPRYTYRQTVSYQSISTSTTTTIPGNILHEVSFQSDGVQALSFSNAFKNIYDIAITFERIEILGSRCTLSEDGTKLFCSADVPEYIPYYRENHTLTQYKPEVWGLNGWTVSEHHYFDKTNKILFTGYGQKISYQSYKTVNDPTYGTVDLVIEKNAGQEIYIFDQQGRHLETRHAILMYPIYRFSYDSQNKLISIKDRFDKITQFIYDSDQKISQIVSPHNIVTQITTLNGLTTKVTNALNQNYEMMYGDYNLLIHFASADGTLTGFGYDLEGNFYSENKSTGVMQDFFEAVSSTFKSFTHRMGVFEVSTLESEVTPSGKFTRKLNSDRELIYSKTNFFDNPTESIDINSNNQTNYASTDPVWGRDFSEYSAIASTITESGQYSNFTSYFSAARSYADPNNPLTLSSYSIQKSDYSDESVERIDYDLINKTITITDKHQRQTILNYNDRGQITEIKPYNQYPTVMTYDPNTGNLIKRQKGTQFETYGYDQYNYLSSITNSKNQTTQFVRNVKGEVLEKVLPNQDRIFFMYTDGGTVKQITVPGGNMHFFEFGIGDYISKLISPDYQQVTNYYYEQDKRLSRVNKPSGKYISYVYKQSSPKLESIETSTGITQINRIDAQDRLRSITSEDGIKTDIDYVYNQIQQQTWYDSDGSVIAKLSNTFASNKLLISTVSLNNQSIVSYSYQNGRINGINDNTISYVYGSDSANSEFVKTYISNLNVTNTFDDTEGGNKSLHTITVYGYLENLQQFLTLHKSYDIFGQATEYTINTYNTTAGVFNNFYSLIPSYDENNRLITAGRHNKSYINGQETSVLEVGNNYYYGERSNNNIKSFDHYNYSDTNNNIQRSTRAYHNSNDQLVSLQGSINREYTYTQDGEVETMTNCYGTINYEYDTFGNLKKITLADGKIIEYKIDGLNRRIKKLVNGQVQEYYIWYDQIRLAAILDENKNPKLTYIYGPESNHSPSFIVKNNKTYKIIHDPGTGSVRYIIDPQTIEIMQELEYDEYGNILRAKNVDFQPLTYAGGLRDPDTKFLRFGARDYDPTIARWTTKDPIGFNGGDTNLYAYVGGNPMSYVDPSGLWGITIGAGIGGYLGGGADIAGGFYFGSQGGHVFAGFYGSGATGFGGGAGVGLQGTFYPDANSIPGSSLNYNANWGIFSGTRVNDPNTGNSTGYGFGLGLGSPRGGSITFGNTGTLGIIGTGDGRPVNATTNVCH